MKRLQACICSRQSKVSNNYWRRLLKTVAMTVTKNRRWWRLGGVTWEMKVVITVVWTNTMTGAVRCASGAIRHKQGSLGRH
mmetsp:Transcript_52377/g.92042  ORF Transcript_52377/g.92042 Transcript_52377/m.92042 type:complete len:81 (+) Transcript_52377:474-716(+)